MKTNIEIPECIINYNVPLCNKSYWGIGGKADIFIEPETLNGLIYAIKYLTEHKIPNIIIGQGTNILFDDKGIRGAVLKVGENLNEVYVTDNEIISESGVYVPFLARMAQKKSLSGLEHIIGIPGTLGGLVAMNGGSLRKGIGDNIVWVETINKFGETKIFLKNECEFFYRHSIFQENELIITKVKISLEKGDSNDIRNKMLEILKSRNEKFPRKQQSCGSVFLSDPELYKKVGPPGLIIELLGLKGKRIGKAEISKTHGNFIINTGNASHKDILMIIDLINTKCNQVYGFKMEAEVKYITPNCSQMPITKAI
jgi:UDP-N-acetylmuramate dehydrogenase